MKKTIISLCLIFSVSIVFGQSNAFNKIFSKYENDPNFTSVYVSPKMFEMLAEMDIEVEGEEDVDGDDNGGASNRDHAAKQHAENAKKTRSQYQQTKKDARAETKQAKADKNAKKEERRKRATKGERKR